ncbi:hypothetical protein GIW46_21105 [Pseudomonas syringae]|nr:hypothetical protein [Pseudomonas syringae]
MSVQHPNLHVFEQDFQAPYGGSDRAFLSERFQLDPFFCDQSVFLPADRFRLAAEDAVRHNKPDKPAQQSQSDVISDGLVFLMLLINVDGQAINLLFKCDQILVKIRSAGQPHLVIDAWHQVDGQDVSKCMVSPPPAIAVR